MGVSKHAANLLTARTTDKESTLPSSTDRSRALTVDPADLTGSFIRASLDVSRRWTSAYLDGLEKAVEFQSQLAKSYASAGEQYVNAAAAVTDRADRAGSEATKVVAKTVDQAAKTQAELVTGPTEEPLADYDQLTAEQIVTKLPAVSQRTLAKVGAYERAHDARATVLARVESLTGKEPAPGYDELTVADIQQLLSGGDEELAKRVREYERAHGGRSGVLQAAERRLKPAA
jgi:hypothetical protein